MGTFFFILSTFKPLKYPHGSYNPSARFTEQKKIRRLETLWNIENSFSNMEEEETELLENKVRSGGDEAEDTALGYSTSNNRRSDWHSDCSAKAHLLNKPLCLWTPAFSAFHYFHVRKQCSCCQTGSTCHYSAEAPGQLHFLIKAGARGTGLVPILILQIILLHLKGHVLTWWIINANLR